MVPTVPSSLSQMQPPHPTRAHTGLADLWPAGSAERRRPSGLCCRSVSWCLESREDKLWGVGRGLGDHQVHWMGCGLAGVTLAGSCIPPKGLRGSSNVGSQWGQGSLTCHIGRQPIYLHLLLPQCVTAIAQAQGRDSVSDQHHPWT